MVHHIIIWQIKDECRDDAARIKADAKRELEGLLGQVPGLKTMVIHTEGLKSSNGDLMLKASYDTEEELNSYTVHPRHVHVAETFVRPFMKTRLCFDYEDDE